MLVINTTRVDDGAPDASSDSMSFVDSSSSSPANTTPYGVPCSTASDTRRKASSTALVQQAKHPARSNCAASASRCATLLSTTSARSPVLPATCGNGSAPASTHGTSNQKRDPLPASHHRDQGTHNR